MSQKTRGKKTHARALVTAPPKRRIPDGALHENLGLRVGTSPVSQPLAGPSADPEAGRVDTENEPEGSCPRVDLSPVNTEVDNENSPDMGDCLASGDPGDEADTSDLSDDPDLVDALQEARRRVVQLEGRQKPKSPKTYGGNSKKTLYSRDSVVRPPPAKSPRLLELNCLILGDDPSRIFAVKIEETKSVGYLKEAIKSKKKPAFNNVDANTLDLWSVSIDVNDHLEEKINDLNLKSMNPLSPVKKLSGVFSNQLEDKHLHIVVQPLSIQTNISHLEAAQMEIIKDAIIAPSPSSAATLNGLRGEQRKRRPIWNGRPSMNRGIPIQLYHPSFAKFLRVVRDDTVGIDLKPEDYSATLSLFHSSAVLYESEAQRVDATRLFLDKVIRHRISALNVSGVKASMKADGAYEVECGSLYALAAIKVDKNEIGTDSRDPSHQCALGFRLYYAREEKKPIRDHCCCPTFLIAQAGPWMCILGAVFVDHVVVERLTNFIWIGGDPYDDDKLKSVTRILASLGTGIAELEEFYKNLKHDSQQDPQRFFPFIRHYSVGEHVLRFSYRDYLVPKTPSMALFRATEIESRREIVVKFAQRYNAEAHRLLASADRAPKLLYCSTEDPNPPELAGLIMVVMTYIDGKTAYQQYGNQELSQPIFDQVEEALGTLHASNMVFGDLRNPNIMITKDERVLLIDFDWCGVHEEHTYPVSLNDAPNMFNSINWHPDVKRGGRMMKEHDTFMLERMKPRPWSCR